jgi:hypothetical protein
MPEPNHERFLQHLADSQQAVLRVAEWLTRKGHTVRLPGVRRAPTTADWADFADHGDLLLERRLEVKHLSAEFTCAADWPFPNVIVCARHAWQRACPKPSAILMLNRPMTHLGVVKRETFPQWWTSAIADKRYAFGYTQEFFVCPVACVEFSALDDVPNGCEGLR